jgi:carbon-monoxide dehydrogenase iron sulfur subunit
VKGTIKVRVETCMGCERCHQACFLKHSKSGTLMGALREDPPPYSNMFVKKVGILAVPTSCHHCAAAVCMAVCPTGAMTRAGAGEPVVVNDELCVGCGNCAIACPYGVPRMTPDHSHVEKCDQCMDRVSEGLLPACVEACPTGTLTFVRETEEGEEAEATQTTTVTEMYKLMLAGQGEVKP